MTLICANCVHTRRLHSAPSAIYFCAISAWLITHVTCQMINHNYIVLLLCSNIEKNYVFRINLLQMCSLYMCFSLCCEVVLRLQFGALDGLGGGGRVKHEAVHHCGVVVWFV